MTRISLVSCLISNNFIFIYHFLKHKWPVSTRGDIRDIAPPSMWYNIDMGSYKCYTTPSSDCIMRDIHWPFSYWKHLCFFVCCYVICEAVKISLCLSCVHIIWVVLRSVIHSQHHQPQFPYFFTMAKWMV